MVRLKLVQDRFYRVYCRPTASGLIFQSLSVLSAPRLFSLGMSMIPSIMACATWTPCGPNSRDRDCASPRKANFPAAKEPNVADPLTDAVAPVISRDGGCGEEATESRRSGKTFCENKYSPRLGIFSRGYGLMMWIKTHTDASRPESSSSSFKSRKDFFVKPPPTL